ncbi:MAG: hypothetical protein KDA34_14520, partial [Phycisphaerales bacterium]|nr:hypothetical protein [Phycisphaerales bacterium]
MFFFSMRYAGIATLWFCATAAAQPSFIPLGAPPTSTLHSFGLGISGDGTTAVGFAGLTPGDNRAFRWTVQTGTVGLGSLPGGNDVSHAQGVNYDGSVIVGFAVGSTGG